MKRILSVVILVSLAFGLLPGMAAAAGCTTYPLFAGQTIPVGTVTVCTNIDGTINVTYHTDSPWEITETHLHLACSVGGIPHTNKGNPIPGQFEYSVPDRATANSVEYLNKVENCSPVYIAAHAVVVRYETRELSVCSDGNGSETFVAYNNPVLGDDTGVPGGLGANPGGQHGSGNAVLAWEPYSDTDPSVWDAGVDHAFTCGDWIWESYRAKNPMNGDIVDFTESFNVPGAPTGGTLWITDDNGYEAKLNGVTLGSAQLFGDWRNSELKQANVDWTDWQSVESWDLSGALQQGTNTFNITGVNEYYYPFDTMNNEPGTVDLNPAGLIYEATITYRVGAQQETAWGAQGPGPGANRFPGANNWATYIVYSKQ